MRVAQGIGILLFVSLVVPPQLMAAEAGSSRPTIGLVLSGGGALGASHVGVIKVLEELHIPVDYVAGASMGSIVGGLYAAGMAPAEMEQVLLDIDWRDIFDDRPPRKELPYRRKVDDLTYLARFEAGFKDGRIVLPTALIFGQKFSFELQRLALRAAGIDDFDQLPIPFRAIATDLETGEMVVLDHGDLGHAMRASMAVPGVFLPITIEDRLLVDGSLARSLPVDVARAMGAEVVIAVDVGEPPMTREELQSFWRVTSQVIGLQIHRNTREQAALADVLIRPQLQGFTSTSFGKAAQLITRGEEEARSMTEVLARYSLSEEDYAAHQRRIRSRRDLQGATLHSVQLGLGSTADPELVMRRIRTRPGDPLDVEGIRKDLQRLYQTNEYEWVDFTVAPVDNSDEYDLLIEAHEKSRGPNYLRFGLNLSADMEGESGFNTLAAYTMSKLNGLGGEAKFAAQLGENPGASVEWYQPLERSGRLFVASWAGNATSSADAYVSEDEFVRYKVDLLRGGVDLGLSLGKYGEVRMGITGGGGVTELRGIPDTVGKIHFKWGGYRLAAVIDQLDYPSFPRSGYFSYFSVFSSRHSLGAETQYNKLVSETAGAVSWGRHTTVGTLNLYSAMGSELPLFDRFVIGGLFQLSGYPFGSISGQYGGSAALFHYIRILRLPPAIGEGIYAGVSLEAGNMWERQQDLGLNDLQYAGSVFIGADTAFGPVYLASGHAEAGSHAWYLYVGRTF